MPLPGSWKVGQRACFEGQQFHRKASMIDEIDR